MIYKIEIIVNNYNNHYNHYQMQIFSSELKFKNANIIKIDLLILYASYIQV